MKRWICWGLLLLLLCGCGAEQAPEKRELPWDMTVEYGESGVEVSPWGWSWNVQEGDVVTASTTEITDPKQRLSQVPFVNRSRAETLELQFAQEPDRLLVQYWTSADGYSEPTSLEIKGNTIPAPTDGESYLFEVIAAWTQKKDSLCWGKGMYYFRYLPQGDTGEAADLPLFRLLQLEPSELFGIEMIDQAAAGRKLCRDQADVAAILDYLKNNLATDFVQTQVPTTESTYVLRLLVTDGSQLTLGYVQEGDSAWILLGGVPYEAQKMDLSGLWERLKTETVYDAQEPAGEYLREAEQYPESEWGGTFVYGYLRALGENVLFDEMIWIEDESEPNGYRLEPGETAQAYGLAQDCQYWILQRHWSPCAQVEQSVLKQWSDEASFDVLFRFYEKDGVIVAICEQYLP